LGTKAPEDFSFWIVHDGHAANEKVIPIILLLFIQMHLFLIFIFIVFLQREKSTHLFHTGCRQIRETRVKRQQVMSSLPNGC